MSNTEFAIKASAIKKTFEEGLTVLKGVDLSIKKGEIVAILGSSGSGKSTLLQILGGLENASSGSVLIDGREIVGLSESELSRLRNDSLGFVYQFHHLLPEFTAIENVAMPLLIKRVSKEKAYTKAKELLSLVGLSHRLEHLPSKLSGGERQRVAIARAVVTNPTCILADEPTGNLDQDSAKDAFNLFLSLARRERAAVLIVTHDKDLAKKCDRILTLNSGILN